LASLYHCDVITVAVNTIDSLSLLQIACVSYVFPQCMQGSSSRFIKSNRLFSKSLEVLTYIFYSLRKFHCL